jgi:hypothetical protein
MYGLEVQSISADEDDEFYTEPADSAVATDIFSPRPGAHPVHKNGGRYASVGVRHSPYPAEDSAQGKKVIEATDLNLPTEGTIMGRLSVRFTLTSILRSSRFDMSIIYLICCVHDMHV